jgi:hypothetical protein
MFHPVACNVLELDIILECRDADLWENVYMDIVVELLYSEI